MPFPGDGGDTGDARAGSGVGTGTGTGTGAGAGTGAGTGAGGADGPAHRVGPEAVAADRRPRRPVLPPPVIALLAGGAMTGVAALLPGLVLSFPLQRPLAALLALAGLAIGAAAVAAFLRARTTVHPMQPEEASTLVVEGLYRWTRNPMYLALLLTLAAWAVWLGHPLNVVLLGAFVLAMNRWQIEPEERALQAKFGSAYAAYTRRVRRWL